MPIASNSRSSVFIARHARRSLVRDLSRRSRSSGDQRHFRSTVICPGEVATPILARRPVAVTDEEKARMLQAEDVGDLILYIATRPKHICLNEVLISPTWNRSYVAALHNPVV